MQQPPEVTKTRDNQVKAIEAEKEAVAVVGEEVVPKELEDEVVALTAHHTSHLFETSRKK